MFCHAEPKSVLQESCLRYAAAVVPYDLTARYKLADVLPTGVQYYCHFNAIVFQGCDRVMRVLRGAFPLLSHRHLVGIVRIPSAPYHGHTHLS